jgi:UDP-glucose 4-epimerase
MSAKAVVTGGAGFIGSALADRLLAEGWKVDVVDDLSSGSLTNLADARLTSGRRFSFTRLDVRNAGVVDHIKRQAPDVVFHLAAQADVRVSVAKPLFDAEVNILGTLNVLEGCVAAKVSKVCFAASGGTLYGTPDELPTREGAPWRPESPYGVSKKVALDYLHYYREVQGLEYSALALANVYGPRQNPHGEAGVVSIFAGRLLGHARPTIFGDGKQTRDFVYVDDVVDAFFRSAERGGGLLMNIGTGLQTSVIDLFETMARLCNVKEPADFAAARPGEILQSALDPGRAEIHLAWKPWTDLEDGLARTLEHFKGRRAAART